MADNLKVGARGSLLSRIQTEWVIKRIREKHPGLKTEFVPISTVGDRVQDRALPEIGRQGVFSAELDKALLEGRIDVAVHSLKDLPSKTPEGLILAAVPEREDPRDVWISKDGSNLEYLPAGSVVGTGSLRRRAQLLSLRPDLSVAGIRGNVDTRIRRLHESDAFSAIILAAAGLHRLDRKSEIASYLQLDQWLPAPGQGALAVITRTGDLASREIVSGIDHWETRTAVQAERALMEKLEAGCHAPLGAWARIENGELVLDCFLGDQEGKRAARLSGEGDPTDPELLGRRLAEKVWVQWEKRMD